MAKRKQTSRSKRKNSSLNFSLWIFLIGITALASSIALYLLNRPTPPEQSVAVTKTFEQPVQVEVLNACGVSGLGAEMTAHLRDRGIDVVNTDNAPRQANSVVIDRVGNIEAARRIAETLGLSPDSVRQVIDSTRYVEVSIIIGSDYKRLEPFRAE